MLRRPRKH